ncbi:MAG: hypothetical protein RIA65_07805, partial [Woeseia sp.]
MNNKNTVKPAPVTLGIFFVTLLFGIATDTLAQDAPFPAASQIAGQWDGVFQCDGYTTSFAVHMQLQAGSSVTGSIERKILRSEE